MRESNSEHTPVPTAAAFREAIASIQWTRDWCERENAHDQRMLQALGPNPYPANVSINQQRQDNRLRHLREAEASYAPIRSAVIAHLVTHAGLATASERVSLTREMQRSPADAFLADQLGELEQELAEQATDTPPEPADAGDVQAGPLGFDAHWAALIAQHPLERWGERSRFASNHEFFRWLREQLGLLGPARRREPRNRAWLADATRQSEASLKGWLKRAHVSASVIHDSPLQVDPNWKPPTD